MIEGTPGQPYGHRMANFNTVESNMKLRLVISTSEFGGLIIGVVSAVISGLVWDIIGSVTISIVIGIMSMSVLL